jgi:signal transduction histidine kinase
MKALGEAALELPWLTPCVASLTTLAGAPLPTVWPQLRSDPGAVLLAVRAAEPDRALPASSLPLLEEALRLLPTSGPGSVDWNHPGPARIYRAAHRTAQLACALASHASADSERAWIGGLLAPLGWLAVCAVDPVRVVQQQGSSLDTAAVARRLACAWRLPGWLRPLVGQLGLHVGIATRLGAEPVLFQVVQLAMRLVQQREMDLGLAIGGDCAELLAALGLSAGDVEELSWQAFEAEPPRRTWESPERQPLLPELLRLALEKGRLADGALLEGLQRDLDCLQGVLERQGAEEHQRLQTKKMAALAEFAAGAGHEINNPLAVISGQAQYVLKQLQQLDGPAAEIDDIGAYLNHLQEVLVPSLHKIIGQTQRIHGILTGLMQFARPSPPRPQPVQLGTLLNEVAESLRELARERQVRLLPPEPDAGPALEADPCQLRMALTCLLRNAVEAAPPEGWAGMRIETEEPGGVRVVVEDNGSGPPPSVREHLFDPFFSGRSAGRGRGLGLPTAWRLARQHGGDVRFDGQAEGLTRFVLTLPLPLGVNGHHAECNGRTAPAA